MGADKQGIGMVCLLVGVTSDGAKGSRRNVHGVTSFIVLPSMGGEQGWRQGMLWTIAVILLVLWALGFGVFHVASGLIHLLIVIAVIVVIVQLVSGRRV